MARHPAGFDGEQFVNHLLDRIERNARSADKSWRRWQEARAEIARVLQTLDISQAANRRHYRDMKAAEAKICEWAEYASQLRAAINAIDPGAIKRKRIVLPDMPGPLETEIPF